MDKAQTFWYVSEFLLFIIYIMVFRVLTCSWLIAIFAACIISTGYYYIIKYLKKIKFGEKNDSAKM